MPTPSFQDLFSRQSRAYARYRPHYPAELFAYLASIVPGRDLAWDCATGNGQAARGLARRFRTVFATDASLQQLGQARPHPRIRYLLTRAEGTCFRPGSLDLVTVAQAVHWFDLDAFYARVRSTLRPGGILAVWSYFFPGIDPAVDRIVDKIYYDVVGPYWSPRMRFLEDGYRSLPFPFEEIPPPPVKMRVNWTLDQLAGFIDSWSGAQKFLEQKGYHPLKEVWDELLAAWGPAKERREVVWDLHFRIGRLVN